MLAILDYGIGNLRSIANMFERIGVSCRLVSRPDELAQATRILLPGVGAFDAGIRALRQSGLVEALNERALVARVPVLGICLGMQLLMESSEEGSDPGLGWIPGVCRRLPSTPELQGLRIPHMGWNAVVPTRESSLLSQVPEPRRFYFVHSYHAVCSDPDDVLATTSYGIRFTSAVARGNIMGVQFHPEKSHKYGMAFLRAFAGIA